MPCFVFQVVQQKNKQQVMAFFKWSYRIEINIFIYSFLFGILQISMDENKTKETKNHPIKWSFCHVSWNLSRLTCFPQTKNIITAVPTTTPPTSAVIELHYIALWDSHYSLGLICNDWLSSTGRAKMGCFIDYTQTEKIIPGVQHKILIMRNYPLSLLHF